MQAILDACTRLRDRLLWALLWDTGIRIGEAIGLRHEDLAVPSVSDGGAAGQRQRGPCQVGESRTVPVSAELIRLYADYLHDEYGDLDLLTELPKRLFQL